MRYFPKQSWPLWLAIGLLVGFVIGGMWPDTPLHAVATDRTENFAMATGFVDDGVEAIYFLDFLTGTLRAAVLSNQGAAFQAHFEGNVNRDLAGILQIRNAGLSQTNRQRRSQGMPPLPELQLPQSPNYLMVTGSIDMRRGAAARAQPAHSALYVAETTTGIVLTYLIAWDRNAHNGNQPSGGALQLWTGEQFTTALIQTE